MSLNKGERGPLCRPITTASGSAECGPDSSPQTGQPYQDTSVGYMEILPHVYFYVPEKPNWFHRLFMRLLLGWQWVDTND